MSSADDPEKAPIPLKAAPEGAYGGPVDAQAIELMTATKNGDREAFDHLTRVLRGRAFVVARSLVGSQDDAMDLTQEAFLKTYKARSTYRDGEPFLPWFHRILRNTCFSFLRKHKRIRSHSLTGDASEGESDWEIEGDEPAPSAGLERDEAAQAFWRGFRRLSSRDREILALRHFQELAYREIAEALEIPEGTVMSRLFHARRRLRDQLAPHLADALHEYAPSADANAGGSTP